MSDDINTRYVEVFEENEWIRRHPRMLKKGQIFKMFEPDGEPVSDGTVFVSETDPVMDENGIIGIEAEALVIREPQNGTA